VNPTNDGELILCDQGYQQKDKLALSDHTGKTESDMLIAFKIKNNFSLPVWQKGVQNCQRLLKNTPV